MVDAKSKGIKSTVPVQTSEPQKIKMVSLGDGGNTFSRNVINKENRRIEYQGSCLTNSIIE